jgi:hypothetical protein
VSFSRSLITDRKQAAQPANPKILAVDVAILATQAIVLLMKHKVWKSRVSSQTGFLKMFYVRVTQVHRLLRIAVKVSPRLYQDVL